jgi:Glycosyl hydrolase family 59
MCDFESHSRLAHPLHKRVCRLAKGASWGFFFLVIVLAMLTIPISLRAVQDPVKVPGTSSPPATLSVALTVANQPAQTLDGFGCSLVDLSGTKIPQPARAEMFDRVFGELRMNVLRLWAEAGDDRTAAQMRLDFYRSYVDTGVIADAQKRGVTTLLLAPARGENAPTEPIPDYARKLADFIQGLKTERGIRIGVTGIANEPGGFNPSQVAEAVRVLRQELDGRGLRDVQIIAPEWASADGAALRCIAGIKADPAAWAALRGIATHSYNMAATPEFSELIAGTGKQYWMTEAADNGNEREADACLAASISARFLNDLNHGVTHWLFFIGFHDSSDVTKDNDNATKLMVYDLKRHRIFQHLKYDWFRQLRAAFPNGSWLYPLKAQPGGDLSYTFGQKPFLNAAMARRPDGGWSLGMVNLSGLGPDSSISQWQPPTTLNVRWQATPLAGQGAVTLKVFHSDATHRFVAAGPMTMTKGTLTLVLKPRELVTLTSD